MTVSTSYDKASQTLALTVKQRTPATKDQPEKAPVMIPVRMGLLGPSGAELPFTVTKGRHKRASDTEAVLIAEDETSTFELSGVAEQPVPSVLRDFSAPVTLTVEGQTEDDLVFILANDTDEINRRAACSSPLPVSWPPTCHLRGPQHATRPQRVTQSVTGAAGGMRRSASPRTCSSRSTTPPRAPPATLTTRSWRRAASSPR